MNRSSGILMSISSLPSPYGIGTLGKAAYKFADFLHASGQKYWQMLPLGPTGFGDSPYQSCSSFAGNPYFIDPDMLIEDNLLTKADLAGLDFGDDPRHVDYGKIYQTRFQILAKAKKNGWKRDLEKVKAFEDSHSWVKDYALFMACKRYYKMQPWTEWKDQDLRFRRPEALEKYRSLLAEDVELFTYIQYLFFQQWNALRSYLNQLQIKTIGDVPIYVPLDSVDVWSEPQFFQLDENYVPKKVAGVPPDYFSEDGQLWGNPLYDWDRMRDDGYGWWIRRIGGATELFDVIRIDHFRGFSEYWAVPYGDKTAKNGSWMQGPGLYMVKALIGWFKDNEFIAEDLGTPTQGLTELLRDSGLPGMKVLGFAFDSNEESSFLPHNFTSNCICYSGTHDNATLKEWVENASAQDVKFAFDYLGMDSIPTEEYIKEAKAVMDAQDAAKAQHQAEAAEMETENPETAETEAEHKISSEKASAEDTVPQMPKISVRLTAKKKSEFIWRILRTGQGSVAKLFVAPIQDYLELGAEGRMNTPSTLGTNWTWRLLPGELTEDLCARIEHLTKLYGR